MVSETVELRGHIIDSLLLPKVLDQILTRGAQFKIVEIKIGQNRVDQSFARIEVTAEEQRQLDELLLRVRQHGAEVVERADVQTAPAPADGVFPADFYVTTNQQTFVRIAGAEVEVGPAMMDSAITVDRKNNTARAVKFFDVIKGDEIVVGQRGIRVVPAQRSTSHTDIFQFVNTSVAAHEPKFAIIRELAQELVNARKTGSKVALVAGPALVLTGAGEHLERLIRQGVVDRIFGGNAFAGADVERALFGTSLGINPEGALTTGTYENYLRAINVVRQCGGIAAAVENGTLKRGIMYSCVKHGIDIVLTGSIRDDGPIPGVTTDMIEAQKIMREKLRDVTHVLLMGTVQHSLAVATMVAPSVKTICVDIDTAAVDRIVKHQPFQTVGLVTDVEPFLHELTDCIEKLADK
jgi:lysine-ketoglutarate reductase/saccharopine dehydrogenase-like protein (TIGR00300 family)